MASPSTLTISATIASSFSCRLTPNRTESLIIAFCNNNGYSKMSMDLIKIIILFFNQLLYWKVQRGLTSSIDYNQHINLPTYSRLTFINFGFINFKWDIPGFGTEYNPHHFKRIMSYRFASCKNVSNKYPIPNEFYIVYTVKQDIVSLKVHHVDPSQLDKIQSIVIRIRIFCVENKQEIEKILIVKGDESIKICNYQDLNVNVAADIGTDAEILHILYDDGNYWAKCPYSWFAHIINGQIFLRDELCYKSLNCFNSRCFMVDNKYYYLFNTHEIRNVFKTFIGYYCQEIMQLPYDIVLLKGNDGNDSELLLSEYMKQHRFALDIEQRKKYECSTSMKVKWVGKNVNNVNKLNKIYKYNTKLNKRHKYNAKLNKIYRNNKRKYQYNRW